MKLQIKTVSNGEDNFGETTFDHTVEDLKDIDLNQYKNLKELMMSKEHSQAMMPLGKLMRAAFESTTESRTILFQTSDNPNGNHGFSTVFAKDAPLIKLTDFWQLSPQDESR